MPIVGNLLDLQNGDRIRPHESVQPFPKSVGGQFAGDIDWNFAKFIINKKGEVVGRFKAGVKPESPEVVSLIEKELDSE